MLLLNLGLSSIERAKGFLVFWFSIFVCQKNPLLPFQAKAVTALGGGGNEISSKNKERVRKISFFMPTGKFFWEGKEGFSCYLELASIKATYIMISHGCF